MTRTATLGHANRAQQLSLDFDPPKIDDQSGHQLPPPRTIRRNRIAKLLATSAFVQLSTAENAEITAALSAGESRR